MFVKLYVHGYICFFTSTLLYLLGLLKVDIAGSVSTALQY